MKYYIVNVYGMGKPEDESLECCWSIYECKPGDYVRVDMGDRDLYEGRVEREVDAHTTTSVEYPIFSNETVLDAALKAAQSKRNAQEALRNLIVNKLSEEDFKALLKTVRELVPEAKFLIDQYMKAHVTTQ